MRAANAPSQTEVITQELVGLKVRIDRLVSALKRPKPGSKLEPVDILVHEAGKSLAYALEHIEDNSAEGLEGLID